MNCIRSFIVQGTALVTMVVALVSGGRAPAADIYDYQLTRTFVLPSPSTPFSVVLFDALPDGRLLMLNGSTLFVETGLKTGTFNSLGSIAGFAPPYGATFLAVSPDGTRAATGTGIGSVTVFSTCNPATASNYSMQDFSGDWIDNNSLAIANATPASGVQVLDTTTLSIKQAITNIGGASAGIALDQAGNLYTGNAYAFSSTGSSTGWIKAFSHSDWQHALATNTPIDFETAGTPVADLLSAYPIGFDSTGNMFVGGGDFYGQSGDIGYAALVDVAAIASALANPQGSPPITPGSPAAVLRKFDSPQDTIDAKQPPSWSYNAATGELYLSYVYGDGTVEVYSAIPEPSCIVLVAMCSLASGVGRKRRR